ncbi:MAG: virulence protein SciE type [Methylococcaceae bacterium]|nr:virulence protein SciE type [Methylococcaceae bacterium]
MQDVSQQIASGELEAALQDTQQKIRKNPADPKLRILLFQLQSLLGNWSKALNQLNVLRDMDASCMPMVQTYEQVLACEALRKEVFAARKAPLIFGEPEEWIALMFEALNLENNGEQNAADELRGKALEQAPAISGEIDGNAFAWIADADSRLSPMLEAVINGRYYWIPFHRISQLNLTDPEDLRDFAWMPAQFVWSNGGDGVGFIPTRYPSSEDSEDNAIKMARKTEWIAKSEQSYHGLGQRILTTDVDDYPLLNCRTLVFNVTEESSETQE